MSLPNELLGISSVLNRGVNIARRSGVKVRRRLTFVLSLIGGGGSVLATPLLVYLVGVPSPHIAIGTGALAVAINAFANLIAYARRGHVEWLCGLIFAASGFFGASLGSTLGKCFDCQKLLLLFGLMMILIAVRMFWRRDRAQATAIAEQGARAKQKMGLLVAYGLAAGVLSGFFGIGGGFLVVPGLLAATEMPMIKAIGSSFVSVTVFGTTTATNYALSGLTDYRLAALVLIGGLVGGMIGGAVAERLSKNKAALSFIFATMIAGVGIYVCCRALRSALGV